jgi:hypothetical protein
VKRLSYIQDARCLKVKRDIITNVYQSSRKVPVVLLRI